MAAEDMFLKRVVYEVPGMDAVEVRRDVVYGRAEDGDLTLDVYLPPGLPEGEQRPGVLLVHGGPIPAEYWQKCTRIGVFLSYGEILAASGLVAVVVNHRFIAMAELPASAANIAAALALVRERAPELRLDPDRLAVWAFSGGGPHLAPFLRDKPSWLRALVSYYAILDLDSVRDQPMTQVAAEIAAAFSPAGCFPAEGTWEGPPILVARAGRDWPLINGTIDLFVARALAANAPLDLMNHPVGQHGFDVVNDDGRSREIIARTLTFLREHL
jgi:acetyl esterase/lipase